MLKSFLFAFMVLFTAQANAGLKVILENRVYDDMNAYRPMLGINYTQKLLVNAAYNQFTGYGATPYEGETDTNWFTTKHQMDLYFGPLTIAPGLSFTYVDKDQDWREFVYLKLEYKIW